MTAPLVTWPKEFTGIVAGVTVAELAVIRDTPPGMGLPWCAVCGEPIRPAGLHVHHILYKSRMGDGRAANALPVHDGCHAARIHDDGTTAAAMGWARSRHAPRPQVYRYPLLCAVRGWIVLLDKPDDGTGLWWRPARDRDMARP